MIKHPTLKIGTSGVRGVVGESLTPQLVASFASAFGTHSGRGTVVIGTDTRPSREMVTQAAISGLLSVGCSPVNIGVVPVPALQFHIRRVGAVGGICITASHNPITWNALKFFGRDGISIRPHQIAELTDLYHQGLYPRVSANEIPSVVEDHSALEGHSRAVLKSVDINSIRRRHFKVAVDCCNAAASLAAPDFLRELGCTVTEINTNPAALFPRNPEPLRENITDLCAAVRSGDTDLGFALDADADRLSMVNSEGVAIGEESTVALAIRHVLKRTPGPVVVNLSTSQMVDEIAAEFGQPVFRTRVGDVHVVEKMLATKAMIGGEGNGGVIYPRINPCRDSFIAMALILESLSETGKTLQELRSELPSYSIIKEKVPCRSREIAAFLRLLKHLYAGEKIDETDGIKVIWPDRWLHVRGSNTEPILRIIAEARSEPEAREIINNVTEYLRPVVK